jgi:two-component system phosphate regulon response regulator PhoB
MAKTDILVVEDEADILELLRYNLVKEGYAVACVQTGEDALSQAHSLKPGLILLDIMLPGVDGLEVCRRLKKEESTRGTPVIMLTAKGEESDIVVGLELGADDYITKPFSPKVLVARVRAVMRRKMEPRTDEGSLLNRGDLVIDPRRHEVLVKGKPVSLTATEFRILHFLARRPGWVFTRQQIVDAVRGEDYAVTERAVDVQMVGLRKKLGAGSVYVETVRGIGYRFKD